MPDKGDWYHLVPDDVMVRRFEPKPTMRCMCCGTTYARGSFRCCAPPAGMASHQWLALSCPMVENGGCGKCAKHCDCPNKVARLGKGPLASLGAQFLSEHGR